MSAFRPGEVFLYGDWTELELGEVMGTGKIGIAIGEGQSILFVGSRPVKAVILVDAVRKPRGLKMLMLKEVACAITAIRLIFPTAEDASPDSKST